MMVVYVGRCECSHKRDYGLPCTWTSRVWRQEFDILQSCLFHYKYNRIKSFTLDSSLKGVVITWNIKPKCFLRGRTCFCWFVTLCSVVSEVRYVFLFLFSLKKGSSTSLAFLFGRVRGRKKHENKLTSGLPCWLLRASIFLLLFLFRNDKLRKRCTISKINFIARPN